MKIKLNNLKTLADLTDYADFNAKKSTQSKKSARKLNQ